MADLVQLEYDGAKADYPADVIEQGLWAVALHGGKYTRASKTLMEQGVSVPRKTLEHWCRISHRNRYQQIRTVEYDKAMEQLAADMQDNAFQAQEAERRALERAIQGVEHVDPVEASVILRNVAQARQSMVTQAQLLRGRPTENVNLTLVDLAREMRELGIAEFEEPTLDVEVVEDAEPVGESQVHAEGSGAGVDVSAVDGPAP